MYTTWNVATMAFNEWEGERVAHYHLNHMLPLQPTHFYALDTLRNWLSNIDYHWPLCLFSIWSGRYWLQRPKCTILTPAEKIADPCLPWTKTLESARNLLESMQVQALLLYLAMNSVLHMCGSSSFMFVHCVHVGCLKGVLHRGVCLTLRCQFFLLSLKQEHL